MSNTVKGRFAPSPSGRMHLGNIFSALLAYASARSQNGSFILRLEDIDERCRNREYAATLLDDLAWLGIRWDEDPVTQRDRSVVYENALEEISRRARVYPCFCSRADLHSASAPHASDGTPLYAGTCRKLTKDQIAEKSLAKNPAIRVEVPDRTVSFVDKRLGCFEQGLKEKCGDFVLRRTDGAFAYQLVVVVDDALSGVTEVVRGADLAASTPRQIWLHELLGYPVPAYAHHPVLLSSDGKRLSKRDKSLDMGVLRESMTPQEIIGLAGNLAGVFDSPAPAALEELIGEFAWKKIVDGDVILEDRRLF